MQTNLTTLIIPTNILLISNLILFASNGLLAAFLIIKLLQIHYQQKRFHAQYHKLLTKTGSEASQILHTTTQKSQQLINSIQNNSKDYETYLHASFKQVVNQQTQLINSLLTHTHSDYGNFLKSLKGQLNQSVNNINRILLHQGNQEIANFAHSLRDNTIISEKHFQKELKSEITQAKKQIKHYQETQFKQIDQNINNIISQVSQAVLSEAISPTEHTDLIIKSLEQAKKDNLLKNLN